MRMVLIDRAASAAAVAAAAAAGAGRGETIAIFSRWFSLSQPRPRPQTRLGLLIPFSYRREPHTCSPLHTRGTLGRAAGLALAAAAFG